MQLRNIFYSIDYQSIEALNEETVLKLHLLKTVAMIDVLNISKLQNPNEHKTCSNFKVDIGTGFHLQTFHSGETLSLVLPQCNHLLFFRKGSVTLSCNEYVDKNFQPGEMVFIPSGATFYGTAHDDVEWINFAFNTPMSGCDKFKLQALRPLCEDISYHFDALPVRDPIPLFLELLTNCLKAGMNCMHLHALKHQELFLYINGFYTKAEVAQLFYPIIGKSLSFRETIVNLAAEAVTVTDLVEGTHMSRRTFQRKFLEEFNEPAKKWLQKRLSVRIMNSLMDPENTLKDIMYECGFSSSSSFNQFCQKNFGGSPSEIRKKIVHTQMDAEKPNKMTKKRNSISQY